MNRPLSLFLIFLFLAGGPARADEVVKKDGTKVKGFLVSQSASMVRIMDAQGRTQRINMADVDAVIESNEVGDPEADPKLGEADVGDATAVARVAAWAKEAGRPSWQAIAQIALRTDSDCSAAREVLGHTKVGDEWFDDPKKAAAARKALASARLKEEGYIRWRNGWIHKDDRDLAQKDPDSYMQDDDGVWRDKAALMKERGMVLVGTKWIPGGTAEDIESREVFRRRTGDSIWVMTTPHFRIFMQYPPPEEVGEFAELVEKAYAWFLQQMALPPDHLLFGNNKGHLWAFTKKEMAQRWFNEYRNDYSLSDQFQTLLSQGGGNILSPGNLLAIHTDDDKERLRHSYVNHAIHLCFRRVSPGLQVGEAGPHDDASWLNEGFALWGEHELLGNGYVTHSTLAKYGGTAGRAEKAFDSKDVENRCKGYVREGDDDLRSIDRLELNSLNSDHLSKAYTMVRWWMKEMPEKFREFIRGRNTERTMVALEKAMGVVPENLDKTWRDMVKKF